MNEPSNQLPDIFCPERHLIFDADHCDLCHWDRNHPTGGIIPRFDPIDLGHTLGRAIEPPAPSYGRRTVLRASTCISQGVGFISSGKKWIFGINLSTGQIIWTTEFPPDLYITLRSVKDRVIAVASTSSENDNRSHSNAFIGLIDDKTGKMNSKWLLPPEYSTFGAPNFENNILLVRHTGKLLLGFNVTDKITEKWAIKTGTSILRDEAIIKADKVYFIDQNGLSGDYLLKSAVISEGASFPKILYKKNIRTKITNFVNDLILLSPPPDFKGKIECIRASDPAELLWSNNINRKFYTDLCVNDDQIFFVARGEISQITGTYYKLFRVDGTTGKIVWTSDLRTRVSIRPICANNAVVLCGQDGIIYQFDRDNGDLISEFRINEAVDNDSIITNLTHNNGLFLCGTSKGMGVIFEIKDASSASDLEPETLSVEECMDHGEYENAAILAALQGDLNRSAYLYLNELNEPHKAIALLLKNDQFEQAGDIAFGLNDFDSAIKYFSIPSINLKLAKSFQANGDLKQAALLFETENYLKEASECYEALGSQYERAKNFGKAADSYLKVSELSNKEEFKIKAGQCYETIANDLLRDQEHSRAADYFLKASAFLNEGANKLHAAECFEKAGERHAACQLYLELKNKEGISRNCDLADWQSPFDYIKYLIENNDHETAYSYAIANQLILETAQLAIESNAIELARNLIREYSKLNSDPDQKFLQLCETCEEWDLLASNSIKEYKRTGDKALFRKCIVALRKIGDLPRLASFLADEDYFFEASSVWKEAVKTALEQKPIDHKNTREIYLQAIKFHEQYNDFVEGNRIHLGYIEKLGLPEITLGASLIPEFYAGEWNTITIEINNIGYGHARQVEVNFENYVFEVKDDEDLNRPNMILLQNRGQKVTINAHHIQDKGAGKVPFKIGWSWQDPIEKDHRIERNLTFHVDVHGDRKTNNVYNAPVTYGGGVNIYRADQNTKSSDQQETKTVEEKNSIKCNNCANINDFNNDHCVYCGNSLNK